MTTIIGDTSTMAVEYRIENKKLFMGYAKLWFGGHSLGSFHDLLYLDGYVIGCLMAVMDKTELPEQYKCSTETSIFHTLLRDYDLPDEDFYSDEKRSANDLARSFVIANCGTFLDDFTVFSFRINSDEGMILWKLSHNGSSAHFLDLAGYSDTIYFSIFSYAAVEYSIQELKKAMAEA